MTEQVDTELGMEAITGIVNPPELAEAQTGQAWSLAEDYPPTDWELPTPPRRMGWEKPLLAIVLLVSLAAAVTALTVFVNQPTPTPAAAPRPAPTPAPPAPTAQPTPDDRFIQLLNTNYPSGYPLDVEPARMIKGGHWVCQYLGENHSTDEMLAVMDDERKSVPDQIARHQMSEAWLEASLAVYCPEFRTPQTRDDAFVAELKANGVAMKNGSQDFSPLIASARAACELLGEGQSRNDIVNSIYSVHTEGETKAGAENFVASSIKYYCPQYN